MDLALDFGHFGGVNAFAVLPEYRLQHHGLHDALPARPQGRQRAIVIEDADADGEVRRQRPGNLDAGPLRKFCEVRHGGKLGRIDEVRVGALRQDLLGRRGAGGLQFAGRDHRRDICDTRRDLRGLAAAEHCGERGDDCIACADGIRPAEDLNSRNVVDFGTLGRDDAVLAAGDEGGLPDLR